MEEEYYFQIDDDFTDDRKFVLIIYDIVDNGKRAKLAKLLQGYGERVQKSAFEALLPAKKYDKLISEIPKYIDRTEDRVRIYRITGKGQVTSWGIYEDNETEEVILI